ncbi:retrovirus-related pol polyprotein from transposon TNT 1-94 [Tanacetum coccineum]|uniref:Retrovirus-related pol polyprotein from transposon TNT 1-94 n=1 Tax=Tanacetum coccineum TaxID=301880 RepID=A0ABQ5IRR8_9ASTR
MISYEQYLKETKTTVVQDTSSSAQQDAMIMSVIEEMTNQVAKFNEVDKQNKIINESSTAELERYKKQINFFEERQKFDLNDREEYIESQLRQVIIDKNAKVSDSENQIHSLKLQLNATVESHKTLSTTVEVLKMESKAKEDKYLEEIIELEKKKKALDNVVCKMAQRKVSALYWARKIVKQHNELSVIDTEETLELAKESRLKMHAKQNDPTAKEKKQCKESFQNNQPCNNQNTPEFHAFFEINELKAQLKAKDNSISKLKDHIATLKGKSVSEGDKSEKISKENADTLREIVEQAREIRPLDSDLDFAKSKKHTHKPKSNDSIQEKIYLLHMYMCGPMRIESINGKKYILVIVDDYSRFTWVKFLRSKGETPEIVIKLLKKIQLHLNATVCNIRIDNETEFLNQTLKA